MLALVLVFTAAVSIPMLDAPLERDEGEYAYAGQLMLEGVLPTSPRTTEVPRVYAAYAVVLARSASRRERFIGASCRECDCIGLVYVLTKRFFGSFAGVVAAASYRSFR